MPTSRAELQDLIGWAAQAYGKGFTQAELDDLLKAWMPLVYGFDPGELRRAFAKHIAESRFFPTVADVRAQVAAERLPSPDVAAAWAEVKAAIGRVGFYRSPKWSNPVIAHVVDALGWKEICQAPLESENTMRAQFERMLKGSVDAARKQMAKVDAFAGLEAKETPPLLPQVAESLQSMTADEIKQILHDTADKLKKGW